MVDVQRGEVHVLDLQTVLGPPPHNSPAVMAAIVRIRTYIVLLLMLVAECDFA